MKTLLRLCILTVLGWLSLSACSPAAAPPTSVVPVNSIPSDSTTFDGLYPAQDLALVAATGRPQFLNSYADW